MSTKVAAGELAGTQALSYPVCRRRSPGSSPSVDEGRGKGEERQTSLADPDPYPHGPGMFVVSEKDAAAIRTAFDQGGELSAAVELRRLFPGITDNDQARTSARTIAGWKPLPVTPRPATRLHHDRDR